MRTNVPTTNKITLLVSSHTHTLTQSDRHKHAHTHTLTHTLTQTVTHTHTVTPPHPHKQVCMYTSAHTHARTHTHTHTHTHTATHTQGILHKISPDSAVEENQAIGWGDNVKRISGQSSVAMGPHLPNQVPLAGHLTCCHFMWHLQVDHLAVGFWNVGGWGGPTMH